MARQKGLAETLYLDNWPRRRRWLQLGMLWFGANAQYMIMLGDKDSELHRSALITCLGAVVALLTTYVFGANQDDKNKRENLDSQTTAALLAPAIDQPPKDYAG